MEQFLYLSDVYDNELVVNVHSFRADGEMG